MLPKVPLLRTVVVGRHRALEPSLLFARGHDEAMSGNKVSLLRTVVVGRHRVLEPSLQGCQVLNSRMSEISDLSICSVVIPHVGAL